MNNLSNIKVSILTLAILSYLTACQGTQQTQPIDSLPPLSETTSWNLPHQPKINAMRETIDTVLQANELEFDIGYPVQGFKPDPIYPRLFIRDTSTLMTGVSYLYPMERLKWGVEGFLRQQYTETTVSDQDGWGAGLGAISATIAPDGTIDKATVVSDEETHLIHAAHVVYNVHGGPYWLLTEINDAPIIDRLNQAGQWLLTHRQDEATGLIKRDHTTDWGDVRFQATGGNPTDINPDDVVWTASIYDQALAYRAWRALAIMNRAVDNEVLAQTWLVEAKALRQAVDTHLWQPERGFYRTHKHLTPFEHDFDEGEIVSIANAVAIQSGLTDPAQTATIIANLQRIQQEAETAKAGLVLYPPYPQDAFGMHDVRPSTYQNGGIWDWWAGWQLMAEFKTGHSQLAQNHLIQTAEDWATHPNQIFEWQTLDMLGRKGDQYAGAAGIFTEVIVEGLYGVHLSRFDPSLSPRLGAWPGTIMANQKPSGLYLRYMYQPSAQNIELRYDTNIAPENFPLELLLPPNFEPSQLLLDGSPHDWVLTTLGDDTYLTATIPSGEHRLLVRSSEP
ncbi:hypothetical protein QUF64_07495 [Anaerolineales bacterium HSG6]|nr:hypothetical protein [Anaerolineales bacterium HSG6]